MGIQKAVIMTRFLNELHDIDRMESGECDPLVVRIYELINILSVIILRLDFLRNSPDLFV